jgi:hypothetical protein
LRESIVVDNNREKGNNRVTFVLLPLAACLRQSRTVILGELLPITFFDENLSLACHHFDGSGYLPCRLPAGGKCNDLQRNGWTGHQPGL